jgi:hypothetical protein
MVVGNTGHREMTRLGATGRENNAAGFGAHETGNFIAGLFDGSSCFTRGAVRSRRITDNTVLPAGHCVGHFIAPWSRGRVIEVVLSTHAT